MIAAAQLADRLGFDSVWLAELHFNPRFSVMPAPLLAAAAIAQTTTRIKIGTAVNLVPLHSPIRRPRRWPPWTSCPGEGLFLALAAGRTPAISKGMGLIQGKAGVNSKRPWTSFYGHGATAR